MQVRGRASESLKGVQWERMTRMAGLSMLRVGNYRYFYAYQQGE
ncbi:MAG: hypothetical protein Kow0060_24830 [Methylohalobius crimeensis]